MQPIRRDLADLLRPWLVWKKSGRPIIEISIWNWDDSSKMIQADLAAAGVPLKDGRGRYADLHSLRHTYITNIGRLLLLCEVASSLRSRSCFGGVGSLVSVAENRFSFADGRRA